MINSLVDKFLQLSKREVYIKRMIADAMTPKGRNFCHILIWSILIQFYRNVLLRLYVNEPIHLQAKAVCFLPIPLFLSFHNIISN